MCFIFGVFDIKIDVVELCKKVFELLCLMCYCGLDWFGIYVCDNVIFVYECLLIVDVNVGVQFLYNVRKIYVLVVNGEIYNYQMLCVEYGDCYVFQIGFDCEVIFVLYQEKGLDFFDDLQGMFVFVLYDSEKDVYLIGCDYIGIILFYMGYDEFGNFYVVLEMKVLILVCCIIKEFLVGSYLWSKDGEICQYYQCDWFEFDVVKDNVIDKNVLCQVLEEFVKSYLMFDVFYGVLFFGGLDLLVILVIIKKFVVCCVEDQECFEVWWLQLYFFVVGLEGLFDLKVVQEVVNYFGIVYYEIYFIVQEGFDVICDVIYYIEIYDVIIICVLMLMYLMLCKIKVMGIKMVFFGEGFDEVFGGYLYFYKVLNVKELYEEMVCKLQVLYMYDCVCVNKVMFVWGVEVCVLFLDKKFFDVVMCINLQDKMCGNGKMEKYVLCECFEFYLLVSVVWCQKEQFFDGVGYSWIDMLKEVVVKQIFD